MAVALSGAARYPVGVAPVEGRAWRAGHGAAATDGLAAADRAVRAKALPAVADGTRFVEAARAVGRRSGGAVAPPVERFNPEGTAAPDPRHGGGPPVRYGPDAQERSLHEFRRRPDRAEDGTATWSLTTLRRALRRAPDGLLPRLEATPDATLDEHCAWYEQASGCGSRPPR